LITYSVISVTLRRGAIVRRLPCMFINQQRYRRAQAAAPTVDVKTIFLAMSDTPIDPSPETHGERRPQPTGLGALVRLRVRRDRGILRALPVVHLSSLRLRSDHHTNPSTHLRRTAGFLLCPLGYGQPQSFP